MISFKCCLIFALIVTVSFSLSVDSEYRGQKRKRSLVDFKDVIKCATGLGSMGKVLKAYNCYGCYCGSGGKGEVQDGIDGCCLEHDLCYRSLVSNKTCSSTSPYLKPYEFECKQSDEILPAFRGKNNLIPVCPTDGTNSDCSQSLCQCDVTFAACIRRNEYNGKADCADSKSGVCKFFDAAEKVFGKVSAAAKRLGKSILQKLTKEKDEDK